MALNNTSVRYNNDREITFIVPSFDNSICLFCANKHYEVNLFMPARVADLRMSAKGEFMTLIS